MDNGVLFPIENLEDKEKAQDFVEALEFGNHKG